MSDKAQQLLEEAKQALSKGDTSRAADLLKQVVEEDPDSVAAWVELSKVLTDRDEQRMALTTVLQLDPENSYARTQLESVEKPKAGAGDHDEVVPGISRRQARTVGIGLAVYTLVVCGATLIITSAFNNSKAAQVAQLAQQFATQTQAVVSVNETATQAVIVAAEVAAAATTTQLALATPLPTATVKRSFELPTEIPPTLTPTTVSYRVEALPPPLPGSIQAWGGEDIRSKDYLTPLIYNLSQPGTFQKLGGSDLVRNLLMSQDKSVTVYEQWRPDSSRLYMSSLEAVTPGGTVDALVSSSYLVINLHDPSLSADAKRIAFIATDYNTKVDGAYVGDLSNPNASKFYKLSQDAAAYTAITLSADGMKAVAVRQDGGSTDLVVFDLANLPAAGNAAQPPVAGATPSLPTVAPAPIPVRPLTTDGNALIESSPSFSADGTRVVYDAASSSAPNNRDLYIATVGTAPGTPLPIMTLDGNDIMPVFSPDGNQVAFASDRQTGIYNIYIYDTATRATYQLTEDGTPVYPSGWSN